MLQILYLALVLSHFLILLLSYFLQHLEYFLTNNQMFVLYAQLIFRFFDFSSACTGQLLFLLFSLLSPFSGNILYYFLVALYKLFAFLDLKLSVFLLEFYQKGFVFLKDLLVFLDYLRFLKFSVSVPASLCLYI